MYNTLKNILADENVVFGSVVINCRSEKYENVVGATQEPNGGVVIIQALDESDSRVRTTKRLSTSIENIDYRVNPEQPNPRD